MAKGTVDEYAGTSAGDGGAVGDVDGFVDPATLSGAGGDGDPGTGERDSAGTRFDPAIHTGTKLKSGEWRTKRNPGKSGEPGSSGAKAPPLSVAGIEALLFSMHQMMAAATRFPELALAESEAKEMAQAAANVARHYPNKISAKTIDWANLAQCLAIAYGSRAYVIRARLQEEAAARKRDHGAGGFPLQAPGMPLQ